MNLTTFFENRVKDVEIYFDFAVQIDKLETYKQQTLKADKLSLTVSRDTQKVIRANCFIILYNLVEATIRNGINTLYDTIEDEEIKYLELANKLKNIWLDEKRNEFSELTSSKKIKSAIQNLIEKSNVNQPIIFNKEQIPISGNLDYRKIEELINLYGFFGSLNITDKKLLGKALLKTKAERNALAHGNKSFRESAEIVTIQKLVSYKDTIIDYLKQVNENINQYIKNKKFKK